MVKLPTELILKIESFCDIDAQRNLRKYLGWSPKLLKLPEGIDDKIRSIPKFKYKIWSRERVLEATNTHETEQKKVVFELPQVPAILELQYERLLDEKFGVYLEDKLVLVDDELVRLGDNVFLESLSGDNLHRLYCQPSRRPPI